MTFFLQEGPIDWTVFMPDLIGMAVCFTVAVGCLVLLIWELRDAVAS